MPLQRQPGHSNFALRRTLMSLRVRVLDRPILSNKPLTDGRPQTAARSLCGNKLRVATGTSAFGMLVWIIITSGLIVGLMKQLGPKLTLVVASALGMAAAMGIVRLFIRLDPPDEG